MPIRTEVRLAKYLMRSEIESLREKPSLKSRYLTLWKKNKHCLNQGLLN